MGGENVAEQYVVEQDAAQVLRAQTANILEMAQEIERLTKDTPAWYADTRTRVEARATLEQAEELGRVLKVLGERLE